MPEPAAEPSIPPEPAPAAPMPAPAPAAPIPAPAPATPVAPMAESANKTAKIKAKFIKLKEAGATLNTKINKNMTVLDVIKECGLTPMECGFDDETHQSNESGVNQLLKVISGFWDKLSSQFTIGGTRAKIKVRKAFEDCECPNATKEDVIKVLKFIDMKDPSSDNTQTHDVKPRGIEKSLPQIAIIASDDKETALLNNIQNMNEQPISENEIDIIKKFAGLTK